jgi:cystathionine beta-lyase family protein involved in aluminum resistance
MAVGDDALAAGMDLVAGSDLANTIDTEINKTRDYIAQLETTLMAVINALTAQDIGAIENSGAYHTKVGWNGTKLEYNVPGFVFPTNLANLSDV